LGYGNMDCAGGATATTAHSKSDAPVEFKYAPRKAVSRYASVVSLK
jgi:hypothetical protein